MEYNKKNKDYVGAQKLLVRLLGILAINPPLTPPFTAFFQLMTRNLCPKHFATLSMAPSMLTPVAQLTRICPKNPKSIINQLTSQCDYEQKNFIR